MSRAQDKAERLLQEVLNNAAAHLPVRQMGFPVRVRTRLFTPTDNILQANKFLVAGSSLEFTKVFHEARNKLKLGVRETASLVRKACAAVSTQPYPGYIERWKTCSRSKISRLEKGDLNPPDRYERELFLNAFKLKGALSQKLRDGLLNGEYARLHILQLQYLGELFFFHDDELCDIKNFGEACLSTVKNTLKEHELVGIRDRILADYSPQRHGLHAEFVRRLSAMTQAPTPPVSEATDPGAQDPVMLLAWIKAALPPNVQGTLTDEFIENAAQSNAVQRAVAEAILEEARRALTL